MGKLTNVTYLNTGGGVMCYSALYDGKYWVFGSTDCLSAYSIDPLNTFDENDCYIDPTPYEINDATDFPTWKEVLDSIPDSIYKSCFRSGPLNFHANYIYPEDDPTYHKEGE